MVIRFAIFRNIYEYFSYILNAAMKAVLMIFYCKLTAIAIMSKFNIAKRKKQLADELASKHRPLRPQCLQGK
jgi:hypothetical protein